MRISFPREESRGRRVFARSWRIVRINARDEVNPCPVQEKREDGEIASNITSRGARECLLSIKCLLYEYRKAFAIVFVLFDAEL